MKYTLRGTIWLICTTLFIYLFIKYFIYLFLDGGMEEDREGEKYQCVVAVCMPPTGDLACNPGMFPDWESNQWPFGSQGGTQFTEPHQPGHMYKFKKNNKANTHITTTCLKN